MLNDKMHEDCAIFGFYHHSELPAALTMQLGLSALQHRGQEASGFCVLNKDFIKTHKKVGSVHSVFSAIESPHYYCGNASIGHNRYSTAGGDSKRNLQPFFARDEEEKIYLALAHNGNLTNADILREELLSEGISFISDGSDSEVVLQLIKKFWHLGDIQAIQETCKLIRGAYSILVLTLDSVIAFRDPHGIRPLCLGKNDDGVLFFSSEDCGLQAVGASFVREIEPGEIVKISANNTINTYSLHEKVEKRFCCFEYIYFARQDSVFDGKTVYTVRENIGKKLFEQLPTEADVVVGVPDSGNAAAVGYSHASGIPYKPLIVKNKYDGSRSFIQPSQNLRQQVVKNKHTFISSEIAGKRIILIDDSIVRGTTIERLVQSLKKHKPKEIHLRIASPPIIAPCFLGIDTPDKEQLIAAQISIEDMRKKLHVDSLEFISLTNLHAIISNKKHCFGCMNEVYPELTIQKQTQFV